MDKTSLNGVGKKDEIRTYLEIIPAGKPQLEAVYSLLRQRLLENDKNFEPDNAIMLINQPKNKDNLYLTHFNAIPNIIGDSVYLFKMPASSDEMHYQFSAGHELLSLKPGSKIIQFKLKKLGYSIDNFCDDGIFLPINYSSGLSRTKEQYMKDSLIITNGVDMNKVILGNFNSMLGSYLV